VVDPVTGQPTTVDFTGQGTAAVQNQMSDQMAQTLLDIQQGLGPQYIAQRLADLKQADPQGYAARQQLFDQIQQEAAQAPPGQALSASTQQLVLSELQKGGTLTPEELTQVQQGVRGPQVASGIFLGNAPSQAEADAVVNAGDQAQTARQGAAGSFLGAGVSPSDIQYRKIQQDLANLGAYISGQTPESQFASLSGAQGGAAPYPNPNYTQPTLNQGQAAAQGVGNAFDLYNQNFNFQQNQVNPFVAGLSGLSNAAGTAFNLGWDPFSTNTSWASGSGVNPWAPNTNYVPGGTLDAGTLAGTNAGGVPFASGYADVGAGTAGAGFDMSALPIGGGG
jgi:hypothetical protein